MDDFVFDTILEGLIMPTTTKFKTAFGGHKRVPAPIVGDSLTHQSFQDECDINVLLSKWQKTGVIEHVNRFGGDYGDFMHSNDYQSSLNAIMDAEEAFMSLPSTVREKFKNDAFSFLSFVENPANEAEMIDMGLIPKKEQKLDAFIPSETRPEDPV